MPGPGLVCKRLEMLRRVRFLPGRRKIYKTDTSPINLPYPSPPGCCKIRVY